MGSHGELWRAVTEADTLGEMFVRGGHRFGDCLAVADSFGTQLTHRMLLERGARLANALSGLGLLPGDRVAAMVEDRAEAVEAYAGIMLAGCVLVHVNVRQTTREVAHILADSGARAVVHTPGVASVVAETCEGSDLVVVAMGGPGGPGSLDLEVLAARASAVPPAESRRGDDLAILAYTSGTTGQAKAAMVSHRSVLSCTRVAPYYYRLPPGSALTYAASVSFVGTVWAQILPALWIGGAVDLLGRVEPDEWIRRIVDRRSAFTYVSSPRIGDFVEAVRRRPGALDSLVTVMHSGSSAPRSQLLELYDLVGGRLTEHWGATEVVGSLTATLPGDYVSGEPDDVFTSVGRPLPTADVRVVDPEGNDVGPGVQGELVSRSDSMFGGYWNAAEKTGAALVDGWFRTADVGCRDEAGFLYIAGRSAELIVSGGANVYPAEVERVIQELPEVELVGVFGLPHPRWGESVTAAIVCRPGARLDAETVVEHCRRNLAGYKKPTRIEFVDELPVNQSQKLDRRALRARFDI